MPILNFHLVRPSHDPTQDQRYFDGQQGGIAEEDDDGSYIEFYKPSNRVRLSPVREDGIFLEHNITRSTTYRTC